jgi:hypothetical protein
VQFFKLHAVELVVPLANKHGVPPATERAKVSCGCCSWGKFAAATACRTLRVGYPAPPTPHRQHDSHTATAIALVATPLRLERQNWGIGRLYYAMRLSKLLTILCFLFHAEHLRLEPWATGCIAGRCIHPFSSAVFDKWRWAGAGAWTRV